MNKKKLLIIVIAIVITIIIGASMYLTIRSGILAENSKQIEENNKNINTNSINTDNNDTANKDISNNAVDINNNVVDFNNSTKTNNTIESDGSEIVDIYHQVYSYEDMKSDIEELKKKFPELITVNIAGVTVNRRNVYEVILGNKNAQNHIIIHGSIHAREYMTALLLMRQLEYYTKRYNMLEYKNVKLSELFNDVAFHIVPMVNPDGVTNCQKGITGVSDINQKNLYKQLYKEDLASNKVANIDLDQYLQIWKANARGVDINKNFNNQWATYDGPKKPARLNYKGINAESEEETKAIVNIVNSNHIVAGIAYHAAGNVIYWDFKQKGQLRQECIQLVTNIRDITGYKPELVKELSVAGFSDWLVMVKGIPAATVEIGMGKSPLGIEQFNEIWKQNRDVWAEIAFRYKDK